jgi:tetrahydromethanopterin S-methyltransferase subunit G
MDQNHHRHPDDAGDRGNVAQEDEVQLRIKRCIDRIRQRCEQQCVAVGRRIHRRLGRDIAVGAGAVFSHEGLPESLRQPLADQSRADVDTAARREARENSHRMARIDGVRRSQLRHARKHAGTSDKPDEVSSIHASPWPPRQRVELSHRRWQIFPVDCPSALRAAYLIISQQVGLNASVAVF